MSRLKSLDTQARKPKAAAAKRKVPTKTQAPAKKSAVRRKAAP